MKNGIEKSILFPAALALFAAMLASGCSEKKQGATASAPVLVAKAVATNVPVQIQPPPVGHVMPVSAVTIHAQVGGILQQVYFKEGSEVKSNALLFKIDARPMQAAFEQVRANLARDKAQLENAKIQSTASKNCSIKNWFRRMSL